MLFFYHFERAAHKPYTHPDQIDLIEQADNQGLAKYLLKEFESSKYPPFISLDETTSRRIYQKHRRAFIISDLAYFAFHRALSEPARCIYQEHRHALIVSELARLTVDGALPNPAQ